MAEEGLWGVDYTRVTASTEVANEPVVLYGAVLLASVDGGDAAIYDGRDTASGNKVITLKGLAKQNVPFAVGYPILLHQGLYVYVGSNVTEVVVFWRRSEG
jgi:hypothetical protein